MTLIELMIVVAIVAALVSVAVPMFTRSTRQARFAEVPAMFAELKLRQQQYHLENGDFLSTGSSEADLHPAGAPAGPDTAVTITARPEWRALRIQPDRSALYCGYVAIAGRAGEDSKLGALAQGFGMVQAPNEDWFYVLAECDFDGKSPTNSLYMTRSDADGIARQNEGT